MHQLENELSGTSRQGDAMTDRAPLATAEEFAARVEPHWSSMAGLARRLDDPHDWEDALAGEEHAKDGAGAGRWRPPGIPAADGSARLDLDRALATLTSRQRLTVELYYYLGLPVAEIAAGLGCADGTVKSTLSNARARLRSRMGEDYR